MRDHQFAKSRSVSTGALPSGRLVECEDFVTDRPACHFTLCLRVCPCKLDRGFNRHLLFLRFVKGTAACRLWLLTVVFG